MKKIIPIILSILLFTSGVPLFALADTAPAITNLAVSGDNTTSASLSWTVSSPTIDSNATYDVRYSVVPITSANFSQAVPAQQTAISYQTVAGSGLSAERAYTIGGLNNGTTYYFAVESTYGGGVWSPLSNVVFATIPSPPSSPSNQNNQNNNGGFGFGSSAAPASTQSTSTNVVTLGGASNGTANSSATAAPAQTADNYSGLVKCSGVVATDSSGQPLPGEVPCDFNYFIITVANLINWGFYIALPIAVVLFAYAGILYISGVESNIKKAKAIFLNVGIGFIIMLVAFTAVHTLLGWLVNPNIGAESLLSK
jgi:hypothetical protein